MPFHVQTDHQIVAHGDDTMALYDNTGKTLAWATRRGDGWNVKSDQGEETAPNRAAAVTAMTEHALAALGGDGYSTLVPHGLTDNP
jgi:hypothetical protein